MEKIKITMSQGIKNQDKLRIFVTISISIWAVGFGFFGNTAIDQQIPIKGQNIEIGGITDIKRLTQFKNIECDLTNEMTQTGETLQLSCEFKSSD